MCVFSSYRFGYSRVSFIWILPPLPMLRWHQQTQDFLPGKSVLNGGHALFRFIVLEGGRGAYLDHFGPCAVIRWEQAPTFGGSRWRFLDPVGGLPGGSGRNLFSMEQYALFESLAGWCRCQLPAGCWQLTFPFLKRKVVGSDPLWSFWLWVGGINIRHAGGAGNRAAGGSGWRGKGFLGPWVLGWEGLTLVTFNFSTSGLSQRSLQIPWKSATYQRQAPLPPLAHWYHRRLSPRALSFARPPPLAFPLPATWCQGPDSTIQWRLSEMQ